jgi:hypothetical protein
VLELQLDLADGNQADALSLLDRMELDERTPLAKRRELQVVHAELLARSARCGPALELFRRETSQTDRPELEERAMFGEASCLQSLGQYGESRAAFRRYLERFPNGSFRSQAQAGLRSNSPEFPDRE